MKTAKETLREYIQKKNKGYKSSVRKRMTFLNDSKALQYKKKTKGNMRIEYVNVKDKSGKVIALPIYNVYTKLK